MIIEADTETMQEIIDVTGLELNAEEEIDDRFLISDEIQVIEGIVGQDSRLIGRSAADMRLRHRFGVNVLAVARHSQAGKPKLANIRFKPGDVLLLQGDREFLPTYSAVLVASRWRSAVCASAVRKRSFYPWAFSPLPLASARLVF